MSRPTPSEIPRQANAPAEALPIVRFVGTSKTYDARTRVVDDLNLDVWQGEFLTLLGPSGSGKTTCLMMLAGFEPWTSGDILLEGKSLAGVPPHRRGMGVVFQNYALFPHMTIGQNVAFPLRQRYVPRDEIRTRVAKALRMVELENFVNRFPSQLSGGQQQRVALARALVFGPKLVLMDEPLGALDKRLREQMQIEIKHIHDRIGMTVVYVTHDQGEALTMSNRIAIFNRGRIEQIGSPQDIYERPETAFVANFVGDHNNLTGTVTFCEERACAVTLREGAVVGATPVRAFAVGDRVQLALRPELVKVEPRPGECRNILSVVLCETIYGGDHVLLRCAAFDNEQPIIAKVSLVAHRDLTKSGRLTIGWTDDSCRALTPD
jgi:putative spermidine/putrescine transport system ATP-binding protein